MHRRRIFDSSVSKISGIKLGIESLKMKIKIE